MTLFSDLNPLLHNQIRLAVMSLLVTQEIAEFNELKVKTGATAGNLSVQVNKLKDAGYLLINKSFRNNYPLTTCKITVAGIDAFEKYVAALKEYILPNN